MISRRGLSGLMLVGAIFCTISAYAGSLEQEVAKAFRKIGLGPQQVEPFAILHEKFLKDRNMQMRRILNSRSGEDVGTVAKKKARIAGKRSVRRMDGLLSELQLKYYAEYLELANEVFLRDAGLR